MAKSIITGAARGPSSDEFKQRMARLAPLPGTPPPDSKRRSQKGKPAYRPEVGQTPAAEPAETQEEPEGTEER